MITHAASQHLARAGELIDEAGRLMREHRPAIEAAALMVSSAPFPTWALDARGRLLYCNREFEAIVHSTLADMRGRTFAESIGRRFDALEAEDQAVLTTARSRVYVGALDGEERQRQFAKWPLFDEVGAVIGLCGAAT